MFILTCVLQVTRGIRPIKYSKDITLYSSTLIFISVLLVLEKLLGILAYVFQGHVQEFFVVVLYPGVEFLLPVYTSFFLLDNGNYFSSSIEILWIFLYLFVILSVFNNLESMWNCIPFSLATSYVDVSLGQCLMNFIIVFIFYFLTCLLLVYIKVIGFECWLEIQKIWKT